MGHSLAVISMNAGAALHVLGKPGPVPAEPLDRSLRAIRQASNGALDELRATLATFTGTLAAPAGPERRARRAVPALVAATDIEDLAVALEVDGEPAAGPGRRSTSPATGSCRRRWPTWSGTPPPRRPRCASRYGADAVAITRDRRRPRRSGGRRRRAAPGSTSMRERAGAVGGTFSAGPRTGGGFEVARRPAVRGRMIRVVLVDDQALVRLGLRTLIEVEPDLDLVGEAGDGAAALDLIRATRPDVALMDVRMPGARRPGGAAPHHRRPRPASCRVVILTTFELDEYVFEALRPGAAGFLTKDAEPAELLRGIRVVAAGDALLSPAVTRRVIERFGAAPHRPPARRPADLGALTEREREIVGWVATGRSNDEIAAALVLSPATVRTHVSRALIKLNARDRAQLVVLAYQSGLEIPHP